MTLEEFKKLHNKGEKKAIKDKQKAQKIIDEILGCPRCKKSMIWIPDTNICVCEDCTYGKEKKPITKILSEKSLKFLSNNCNY